MGKKNKTPFALRFIQWFFPKLEALAPSLAHRYFIHLFYTPFHYKLPEKEEQLLKTSKEFTVTVDGKRIQCYRWGTMGRKVLLVHGWAGRAGQFRSMIPALLTHGFQAVAFDGPAHGKSEGKQTNPIEFADTMKAIMKVEGELHAIVAHSFGGVAALYAISHGLPVRKLITISSPTIAEQVVGNYRRVLNASEAAGQAFRDHLMKTYGITFEEISSLHLIRQVPAPLDFLMIQDENDPEVAVENATELKKVYPAATIHLTKGLGHTRILRDEGVISLILKYLET